MGVLGAGSGERVGRSVGMAGLRSQLAWSGVFGVCQPSAGGDEIAANGYLFRIAGNPTFGIFTGFRISASVAQLAEQRFCKPQVVGSSPSAGS